MYWPWVNKLYVGVVSSSHVIRPSEVGLWGAKVFSSDAND